MSDGEGSGGEDRARGGERKGSLMSNLSSSSTQCPANESCEAAARSHAPLDSAHTSPAHPAACAASCWPPASPKSAGGKKRFPLPAPSGTAGLEAGGGGHADVTVAPPVAQSGAAAQRNTMPARSLANDLQHALAASARPNSKEGDMQTEDTLQHTTPHYNTRQHTARHCNTRPDSKQGDIQTTGGTQRMLQPPCVPLGAMSPQQPSSGDSESEHVLSQSSTAEDTPRPLLAAASPDKDTERIFAELGVGGVEEGEGTAAQRSATTAEEGEVVSIAKGAVQSWRRYTLPTCSSAVAQQQEEADESVHTAVATRESAVATRVLYQVLPEVLPSIAAGSAAGAATARAAHYNAQHTATARVPPSLATSTHQLGEWQEPTTCCTLGKSPALGKSSTLLPTLKPPQQAAQQLSHAGTGGANTLGKERGAEAKGQTEKIAICERKLHCRQDELGNPTPGKAVAGKKQDFAALMAVRQQKMRDAEEADEGMYFD